MHFMTYNIESRFINGYRYYRLICRSHKKTEEFYGSSIDSCNNEARKAGYKININSSSSAFLTYKTNL